MDNGKIAAIVLAAGSSSRMGGVKKEFKKLETGATVLEASVCAFLSFPAVETIVIAINEHTEAAARMALPPAYLSCEKPKIVFVNGGNSRRASVFNALNALMPYNPDYVLIHDGARPWVSASLIENIICAVKKHNAVIPLLPLTDTPKECDAPFLKLRLQDEMPLAFIKNHLKRSNTGTAQTPQGFKFPEILHAHEKASHTEDDKFTDDAEIWGRFCGSVAVIPGEHDNRKITFPEDLN